MYKINYSRAISILKKQLRHFNNTYLSKSDVLLHNERIYELMSTIESVKANSCIYNATLYTLENDLDAKDISSALINAKTIPMLKSEAK